MSAIQRPDVLFAAGHFLDGNSNVVDVDIFTGLRLDPTTAREIGCYIITITGIEDEVIGAEVPVGSRDIRHPSVSGGVREAWSIPVGSLVVGFAPSPVDSPAAELDRLVVDNVSYPPVSADNGGITL